MSRKQKGTICRECSGTGRLEEEKCPKCGGRGWVRIKNSKEKLQ